MGDYISREAAIELAQDMATAIPLPKTVVEEVFNKIPYADVRDNVRGEWISKIYECSRENYDQVFCCSVCGVSNDWRRTNFCPHCGAEMRGDKL